MLAHASPGSCQFPSCLAPPLQAKKLPGGGSNFSLHTKPRAASVQCSGTPVFSLECDLSVTLSFSSLRSLHLFLVCLPVVDQCSTFQCSMRLDVKMRLEIGEKTTEKKMHHRFRFHHMHWGFAQHCTSWAACSPGAPPFDDALASFSSMGVSGVMEVSHPGLPTLCLSPSIAIEWKGSRARPDAQRRLPT